MQLKMRQYKTSSVFDSKQLTKYNFLTSRYYSALDIELEYKADVVMITEVIFAEHSILDPQTEAIQIAGRFRSGTKTITHIANFNSEINSKTPEQARSYMDGQQEVYRQILKLKETMMGEGQQDAINQILNESKFAKYFRADGSYNWFMLDNYIQEERVMGLYKSSVTLTEGYALVADHFDVNVIEKIYVITDGDKLKRQSAVSRKDEIKEVVSQLKRIQMRPDNLVLGAEDFRNELIDNYPDVVKAFDAIGEQGILDCGYLESRMKQALTKAQKEELLYSTAVLKVVHEKFKIGIEYLEMYVISTLQDIYDRNGIKEKAHATHIKRYFDAIRTTNRNGKKVYVLHEVRSLKVSSDSTTD
jgi:hypothetical protein